MNEIRAREQATLDKIASTPATERKIRRFEDPTTDSATASVTEPAAPYIIVELAAVNNLISVLSCNTCGGSVKLVQSDQDYGLATKLTVVCEVCGEVASGWSSPRIEGPKTCNPFEVNILAMRAMLSTGNGQTAMNDIFSAMGLSRRGMHKKTFQQPLKKTLKPAATQAAEIAMKECAREAVKIYDDLCFGHKKNIAICYDGAWMTRGHSSHIGVGAVVELFTGYVLDYQVL